LIPALLLSWRWTRGPLVGWLFFFVAIFPTLGVVGFTDVIAADRFVYLPALGPLLVLTWLLARAWVDRAGVWRSRVPAVAVVIVVVLVGAAESTATRRYLSYWQDMEKLHRRMVVLAPQAPETHYNLGVVMAKQGNLAEAIRSFSEAIRIRPSYAEAHYNLGVALLTGKTADIDRAMTHFTAAIQIRPHYRAAHKNLAAVLVQKGRSGEAIEHYAEALRLQPDDYSAHYGLARALAMEGRDAEAVKEYREVLRLKPDHAEARRRLAASEKQATP
ncbi:MAG TPA: tetratricopeptide repeat protein, partial [Phycisphaerae bacterium]|nr:tetratricopeptide repeat protein [Phycisphaerae bacterium]